MLPSRIATVEWKHHSLASPVTTNDDVSVKLHLLVLTGREQGTIVVFLSGELRVPGLGYGIT